MKSFTFENARFCLTIGEDATAQSLVSKCDGVECLADGLRIPLFSLSEERPYNNEIKLAYMNKRTTFEANRLRCEGDRLIVGFELVRFEAVIEVKVTEDYMTFTLVDFLFDKEDFPHHMDIPPVDTFTLLQLPALRSLPYGQWTNICHNERSVFGAVATSAYGFTDSMTLGNYRILSLTARSGYRLRGCTAALVCSAKEQFLDVMERMEEDFGLPHGAKSRKDPILNASIYWTSKLTPQNVDRHIAYAKRGGFRLMTLYYTCMTPYRDYRGCGQYDYNTEYPNGDADMRVVLQKIKAAGIIPGLHVLHTHIGFGTKYVTPYADHRLHSVRKFTLARPLGTADDVIYVEETPIDSPMHKDCRVLRFDGELIEYEGYTTERPYCFYGCRRGHLETTVASHERGAVGGVLHISEFGAMSAYIDQDTSLQDEVAESIAHLYDLGFEYLYYDGSEGVQDPFEFHISNAQYRVWKQCTNEPLLAEGAAKTHFGWHMLSGANAFDIFPTPIFKEKILEFPFHEAKLMQLDFTRVNFGWWKLYADTRVDVHEFGNSKAAAWDCPVTVQQKLEILETHPRIDDILDMMRRWEDVRARKWLTAEQKEMLKNEAAEFTLLQTGEGEYELLPYEQVHFDKYQGVTAFVFERNGKAHVVLWDDLGRSRVTLPTTDLTDVSVALGGHPTQMEVSEGATLLTLARRMYLKTNASKGTLVQWLQSAVVER